MNPLVKVLSDAKKARKTFVFLAKSAPIAEKVANRDCSLGELVITVAVHLYQYPEIRNAWFIMVFTAALIMIGYTVAVYYLGKRRGCISRNLAAINGAQEAGCMCCHGGIVVESEGQRWYNNPSRQLNLAKTTDATDCPRDSCM